jgi:hypothetical protein
MSKEKVPQVKQVLHKLRKESAKALRRKKKTD